MRTQLRHVESEQLLRYADGELTARAAGKIRGHLEACWQCRAGLEELQTTIGHCVRYRKTLQQCLPSPPAPWFDIYHGFAEIDAAAGPGFFAGLMGLLWLPARSRKAWAMASLALLIAGALVYRFRESPSVQAAELLRRAVAAAGSHAVSAPRIEIRTSRRRLMRLGRGAQNGALSAADLETSRSLEALFVSARFDWNDPLSARAFGSWRDQLPSRQDEVIQEQDSYRLRTSTAHGALASASLKLRLADLRPLEERLEFRNQEWVEIREVFDGSLPAVEPVIRNLPRAPASVEAPAAPRPLRASQGDASIADELHVVAALHGVGADLGDPLEISRAGGTVLVTGVGIAPQRQQEIQQALAASPRVVVRFTEPGSSPRQPEAESRAQTAASGNTSELQAQIARQMGGRVRFDELGAQVLDLSDAMMTRVFALRRLAERFTPEAEAALGSGDERILADLRRGHLTVIRQKLDEIDRLLRPALLTVNEAVAVPPANSGASDWQSAAEDLFQSARTVEKLTAEMFGAAPGESADQQLPSRLLSGLAQLRAGTEAFDRVRTGRSDR